MRCYGLLPGKMLVLDAFLPYKQEVAGWSPALPTINLLFSAHYARPSSGARNPEIRVGGAQFSGLQAPVQNFPGLYVFPWLDCRIPAVCGASYPPNPARP